MSRVQLALNVSDLDVAVAFCSTLFGVEVASTGEVATAATRLAGAGLTTATEEAVACRAPARAAMTLGSPATR